MTSREDQQKAKAMNNEQELFAAATKNDVANAVKHLRNWMSYIDNHNRQNYADLIEEQAKLIAWLLAQRDASPAALRAASAPPATGDVRRALWMLNGLLDTDVMSCSVIAQDRTTGAITKVFFYLSVGDFRRLASVAPGPSEAAIQKSAPVQGAPHNSGERDPAVTPDWAGADTEPRPEGS